jgi:hypothetical protein
MVPDRFTKVWVTPFFLLSAILVTTLCSASSAGAKSRQLRILFISSFRNSNPGQIDFESGLDKSLGHLKGQHQLYFEFMGSPILKEEATRDIFAPYLEKKYEGIRFDFVVAWAPRACRFLKANETLFPGVHRIYVEAGMEVGDETEDPPSKSTAMEFENDYRTAIEEAVRLTSPEHFFVIGTSGNLSAQNRLTYFRNSIPDEASGLPTEYLLDQPTAQIGASLEDASEKNTIAFYLLMFSDGQGTPMPPQDILTDLSSRSAVPIFSFWESMMGHGAVGGYVFSHQKIGFHLGETMLAISNGEAVQDFSPMRYVYDWRELEKWGIDKDRLPSDSVILNRPPNILKQYRWHLLITGVVFIALTTFLFFLLWALKQRNIALGELDIERKTLEKKVGERTADLLKTNRVLTDEIETRKQAEAEKEHIIIALEEALEEIKTLKGILPLCSFCKKIRNDKGYWEQVDVYINKHSEADISHSVCPECLRIHYPEIYASMPGKKDKDSPDA